jgi:STE24 endopeptidase
VNVYAALILGALLLEHGLGLVSDLLNLRSQRGALPDAFADTFDADEYATAQDYTAAQTRFGILTSTVQLSVLLAFWFAGGFEWLDTIVRAWNVGPVGTGLCYIGLLVAGRSVLSLPFQAYSTFVIEERFGFNETTGSTFVLDRLKGAALGVAIGGPLLAAVLWFFEASGPYAWVYAWLVVTAITLALQFLAPRYLMPLFNDFEPLADGDLRDAILAYADAVDFALDDIYVMDGSRRSSKSNAFFTGFGANRRIVLFDTLVEQHSVDELVTVVAHEVGHYKRNHIPQRMAISVLHTGVLFLLLSVFLQVDALYEAFYVDQSAVYTGLLFFGLLYTPVDLLLSLPLNAWSRRHEFEADRFAVDTAGQPETFIGALKQLAETNLAALTPHPLTVALEYSHPPLTERIDAIRDHAGRPAPEAAPA